MFGFQLIPVHASLLSLDLVAGSYEYKTSTMTLAGHDILALCALAHICLHERMHKYGGDTFACADGRQTTYVRCQDKSRAHPPAPLLHNFRSFSFTTSVAVVIQFGKILEALPIA